MRLDKLLNELNYGTRSELKKILKSGIVTVNGVVVKKGETQVVPDTDIITCQGERVFYEPFEYYILNKPAGYVSATKDNVYPTVMELLTGVSRTGLAPVGRLDVDTEGLLLITNDGQLTHRLLSPKHHVDKVYYAEINGIMTDADVTAFSEGLDIGDDKPSLPATLTILETDEGRAVSKVEITLREGRFHQVKRMVQAVGKEVTFLKRLSMGGLTLPEDLATGAYRRLTGEEVFNTLKC